MQDDSKIEDDGKKRLWGLNSYKTCNSLVRLKANKSQPNVDRVSAEYVSTIYRPTSGHAQESIDRHHISRSTLDRLSTDCRPKCRSSVDRVSIDGRSRVSIDTRSRMPLVHMILGFVMYHTYIFF